MKLAVALLIAGIGLMVYAMSMPAYTDEELFRKRYLALPSGASEEYWKLRDEMLTPKFKLQDYGATLVFAALLSATVAWRGYAGIRAPSSRVTLDVIVSVKESTSPTSRPTPIGDDGVTSILLRIR